MDRPKSHTSINEEINGTNFGVNNTSLKTGTLYTDSYGALETIFWGSNTLSRNHATISCSSYDKNGS